MADLPPPSSSMAGTTNSRIISPYPAASLSPPALFSLSSSLPPESSFLSLSSSPSPASRRLHLRRATSSHPSSISPLPFFTTLHPLLSLIRTPSSPDPRNPNPNLNPFPLPLLPLPRLLFSFYLRHQPPTPARSAPPSPSLLPFLSPRVLALPFHLLLAQPPPAPHAAPSFFHLSPPSTSNSGQHPSITSMAGHHLIQSLSLRLPCSTGLPSPSFLSISSSSSPAASSSYLIGVGLQNPILTDGVQDSLVAPPSLSSLLIFSGL